MDKKSAESSLKKIKSSGGAKSFDETTDEELLELAKTVDVKTRIQSTLEDQPKEISKQHDPLEDEELKEINLKAKLEMFKQETVKKAAENKVSSFLGSVLQFAEIWNFIRHLTIYVLHPNPFLAKTPFFSLDRLIR